ncbi:unnamed protein product [Rotaria sordida]|uniref:Uncharacterized protein n=1 Tax=Rotaria sordida TaxID=392033 RepID=A0A818WHU9_9BILA|nr:unnamed protein product [Rotaria sordida]
MLTTVILFIFFLFINHTNGRTFHTRDADSLVVMRERCAKTPYVDECTGVKSQMEDLLRKCRAMVTPVPACDDVKNKYCFIWPSELYCYGFNSGGGGGGGSDSDWSQIPSDPNELKRRGDYCVTHQAELKCRNLLNALKIRYDECSKRPKTDISCQNFKGSLCSAFPNFSPCIYGGGGLRRRVTQLENYFQKRHKVLTHHQH